MRTRACELELEWEAMAGDVGERGKRERDSKPQTHKGEERRQGKGKREKKRERERVRRDLECRHPQR